MFKLKLIPFLIVFIAIMAACKPTKYLAEGEYLLTKVNLDIKGKIEEEDMETIVKQYPNRKILGTLRFHLGVYNAVDKEKLVKKVEEKQSKLVQKNQKRQEKGKSPKQYKRTVGEWLTEDVGEAPVIYDELLVSKSTKQLEQYLKNKGYYNGTVANTSIFQGKKAEVVYKINAGKPYRIRKLKFSIQDTTLFDAIMTASKKTNLNPGSNCDVEMMEKERIRIEKAMKNKGYYAFSSEYVYFEIDSNLNNNKVDIKQIVKSPLFPSKQNEDSLIVGTHQKYYIGDIYVNPNYNPRGMQNQFDTLVYNGVHFIVYEKLDFRPEVLVNNIFIKKDSLYQISDVEYTNSRIGALRTFRFINILFEEVDYGDGIKRIDCKINLVPIAKHSFVSELETTTNRMAPLGISGGFFYRNKNTFKGAERFEVKFSGGVEAQKQLTDDGNASITSSRFFNTIEFGPELSLFIPSLTLPKIINEFPRFTSPKTTFSIAYSHQTRLDYKRDIAALNVSYNWKPQISDDNEFSKHFTHTFQPFHVNLVRIDKTTAFENQLQATNNRFLINTYQNHLIASSSYTLKFDNNDPSKEYRNTEHIKFNIEGAGNILRGIHSLASAKENTNGGYELLGIQFAQYIKPEADFRFYRIVNKHSKMVYRMFAGIGIPLRNLDVLPFEKSYFGGGANGLRAWTARTLGPGTLSDTASTAVDRIGDIQLEGNVEYRFHIFDMLEGAAFADFGNIWLRNYDPQRVGGQFEWDNFYKATAIGLGLGARFDFSFLIIRLDVAMPIKDPALVEGERWVFQSKNQTNTGREIYYGDDYKKYKPKLNFNFGIGYPF